MYKEPLPAAALTIISPCVVRAAHSPLPRDTLFKRWEGLACLSAFDLSLIPSHQHQVENNPLDYIPPHSDPPSIHTRTSLGHSLRHHCALWTMLVITAAKLDGEETGKDASTDHSRASERPECICIGMIGLLLANTIDTLRWVRATVISISCALSKSDVAMKVGMSYLSVTHIIEGLIIHINTHEQIDEAERSESGRKRDTQYSCSTLVSR